MTMKLEPKPKAATAAPMNPIATDFPMMNKGWRVVWVVCLDPFFLLAVSHG